ncbi:uncharacterized protein CC84DRAFT_1177917 [Paraphaeosphaeria sporulosa]|uniref:Uncharacterized protein n=1 Tax=Paraphaeosphaeria sporulosa TaxID=1460663 RepID=A0A177CAX6_9PLEO|nr:uncharacterized protein CC84DRAFT_1177917 [Paraphaeosphaeria sporulosa]OAG04002.1 hypothetical protein CC84DRAFT_1177917 [Paraphaeosphaeria sporulosa]
MASEDMVFIENGPSMQLVPSSSLESLDGTNASRHKEFPHTYSPAPPTVAAPSLGCNPCGLAIRSKPGFASYPPVPVKSPGLQHCCHGNCQQNEVLAKVEDSFEMPPGLLNLPPPPVYNGSTSAWLTPGARTKSKKAARAPRSPSPTCKPPPQAISLPPPPPAPVVMPPPPFPLPPVAGSFPPPMPMAPPPPSPPYKPTRSRGLRFLDDDYSHVSTPADLIPIQYSGESNLDTGRVVRIMPFNRNVLTIFHRAHITDFEEVKWILQHGTTDVWYEKPKRSWLRQQESFEASGCDTDELEALENARPVSLETPRIWASAALVTPSDDDIFDCTAGHTLDDAFSGACPTCTDEKSEALDGTPLVYYVVLSTCQASEPFIHGAHFNGRQIHKLFRCGGREAAVAEAFYASGVNGWSVAFSCVMRADDELEGGEGKIKRVDELWMLGEDEEDDDCTRVFF